MRNKKLAQIMFVLIMVLALEYISGCENRQDISNNSVPRVVTADIKESSITKTITTSGTVSPWEEATLSFGLAGEIVEGPYEEGKDVLNGTTIAKLDDAGYRIQVDLAKSKLNLAKIEYEHLNKRFLRFEQLQATGAISQQDFEDTKYAFEIAEANLKYAEDSLKHAELALAHCNLKSPFEGVVLQRMYKQGETVSEGTPVVTIGQVNNTKIKISIPAVQIPFWDEGKQVHIIKENSPLPSAVKYKASVYKVAPKADENSGMFEVELKLENSGQQFKPGELVTVQYQENTSNSIWIPLKSVISRGESLKYVFVLINNEKDTVCQRPVKLGEIAGDLVNVVQGLGKGDKILVIMPENLRDGDKVQVVENETN